MKKNNKNIIAMKPQKGNGLITLRDLLVDELKDLYDAENRLLKALPKVAKAASSSELQEVIEGHLQETRGHVERLEQAFEKLGEKAKAKPCKAMKGLLEEGEEIMGEEGKDSVIDAGIIVAAQKVEHYEIAGYGSVCSHARLLGLTEVADLMEETLDEEKEANEKLTEIATNTINAQASSGQEIES
jgi:ferritin-like metal-binding protein YciE